MLKKKKKMLHHDSTENFILAMRTCSQTIEHVLRKYKKKSSKGYGKIIVAKLMKHSKLITCRKLRSVMEENGSRGIVRRQIGARFDVD